MLAYALILANIVLNAFSMVLSKKFQLGFRVAFGNFILYNLYNALFACLNFLILSRFRISVNLITFWYALAYAAVVILSLSYSLLMLYKHPIGYASVLSSAGGIITSAIAGVLIFKEKITVGLMAAIVLFLVAIFLPVKIKIKGKLTLGTFAFYAIYFLNAGAANIITKLYTSAPGACDNYSFCFIVNIILTVVTSGILIVMKLAKPHAEPPRLGLKQILNVGARTLIGNAVSLIALFVLRVMNVSVYSTVTSAAHLVSNTMLSKFYFKENLRSVNYISLLLAVCAVILSAF